MKAALGFTHSNVPSIEVEPPAEPRRDLEVPAMSRLSVLLFPAIAFLAATLIACGGKGSPASDEEAAGAAAAQSVRVILGLFDGSTHGKDLLEVFAPECREGVKASDIDSVLFLIRAFVLDLGKTKIEAVDLGELRYNRTAEGIEVT